MLDLAFELIGQVVSNSLLMFCFCNIIIVMILKGSKPDLGVSESEETNFPHSGGCSNMDKNSKEEMGFASLHRENDQLLVDVAETNDECKETVEYDEENDDDCGDYDDQEEDQDLREDEEEEEKDDELRKRVEAFIAKVNRDWKNEKLRALNLQT